MDSEKQDVVLTDGVFASLSAFCDNVKYVESAMLENGIPYAYGYLLGSTKGFLREIRIHLKLTNTEGEETDG